MVPIRGLPPGIPFTLQFTGAFGPVAVKVCVVPSATLAVVGETVNPDGAGVGVGVGEGDGTGVGVGVGVGPFAPTSVLLVPAPLPPQATMLSARQQMTAIPKNLRIRDSNLAF